MELKHSGSIANHDLSQLSDDELLKLIASYTESLALENKTIDAKAERIDSYGPNVVAIGSKSEAG